MANDPREQLSAEFALGALSDNELETALQLMDSDPEFVQMVEAWQDYLYPLSEALPAVDPSQDLLAKIEHSLDRKQTDLEEGNVSNEISAQLKSLRDRLSVWRLAAFSLGATALAGFVFILIMLPSFLTEKPEQYVAVLRSQAGQDGFIVTLQSAKKRIVVRSLGMWPPPSKSYELWVIQKGDAPPETLGLVATSPYVILNIPDKINRRKVLKGLKFAVSLEPEGGARNRQSMGKVLFAGELVQQMP